MLFYKNLSNHLMLSYFSGVHSIVSLIFKSKIMKYFVSNSFKEMTKACGKSGKKLFKFFHCG